MQKFRIDLGCSHRSIAPKPQLNSPNAPASPPSIADAATLQPDRTQDRGEPDFWVWNSGIAVIFSIRCDGYNPIGRVLRPNCRARFEKLVPKSGI